MAEAAFNMIAETQRLRDAGLPHGQAEAVTLAIHAGVTGGVATKADLEALRGDFRALRGRADVLDTKIDSLGDRLDTKIDNLGDRLDTRIDHVADGLRKDIRALDARIDAQSDRITLRLGVVMAATAAALFAALRYLPPPG